MRELGALQRRTVSPAPLPHQFIGTVVDNTIGLLTAPANALDGSCRRVTFSEDTNWLSLMQAVHWSFLSSIHRATEKALSELCQAENLQVPAAEHRIRRASFNDYLEAVLKTRSLENDAWREFFSALSILRNKVSHSQVELSELEKGKLRGGGLGECIDASGNLQFKPERYLHVTKKILDFLDLVSSPVTPEI